MREYLRRSAGSLLLVIAAFLFSGCAEEVNNPIAVQTIGGAPPTNERIMMDLDARGFINGVFYPGTDITINTIKYPVKYTGDWHMIKNENVGGYYIIMSETPGARVDIVASVSRVVFEFWDNQFYSNPGKVTFEIDGDEAGEFDLKTGPVDEGAINHCQVMTGKSELATVSMVLSTGTVVISGYLLVFPAVGSGTGAVPSVRMADDIVDDEQDSGEKKPGE